MPVATTRTVVRLKLKLPAVQNRLPVVVRMGRLVGDRPPVAAALPRQSKLLKQKRGGHGNQKKASQCSTHLVGMPTNGNNGRSTSNIAKSSGASAKVADFLRNALGNILRSPQFVAKPTIGLGTEKLETPRFPIFPGL